MLPLPGYRRVTLIANALKCGRVKKCGKMQQQIKITHRNKLKTKQICGMHAAIHFTFFPYSYFHTKKLSSVL
jgi:hypothetical protein